MPDRAGKMLIQALNSSIACLHPDRAGWLGDPGPGQEAGSFTISLGLAIDFHPSGEVFYLFPGIWL